MSRFDEHGTLLGERARILDTFGVGVMKQPRGRDSLSNGDRAMNKGNSGLDKVGTSQSETKVCLSFAIDSIFHFCILIAFTVI